MARLPLAEIAVEAARAGAAELVPRFRRPDLEVAEKAPNDLVSEADRASEAAVLGVLGERASGHGVLAEEGGIQALGGGTTGDQDSPLWIVDPLDGTTNFVRGLPIWGVSVACWQEGAVVAGAIFEPLAERMYVAQRGEGAFCNGERLRVSGREGLDGAFLATGYPFKARKALDAYLEIFRALFSRAKAIRRCGAAVLDLAYTAAGSFDGFFEFRLSPWDLAAGTLLIEEAGGVVSDLDGAGRYLRSGNLLAGSPAVHAAMRAELEGLVSEAQLDELAPDEALKSLDVLGL